MAPLFWSTQAITYGIDLYEKDVHLMSLNDLGLSHYLSTCLIDCDLSRLPYLLL